MIILGIDPGYCNTGYGIIDVHGVPKYIASGCIRLDKYKGGDRLKYLQCSLEDLLHKYNPEVCAIEGIFLSKNPSSTIKLAQTLGVALCTISRFNIPCNEYAPRYVKLSVTGKGSATKEDIVESVFKTLRYTGKIRQDSSDALALALCHFKEILSQAPSLKGCILSRDGDVISFQESLSRMVLSVSYGHEELNDHQDLILHNIKNILYGFKSVEEKILFTKLTACLSVKASFKIVKNIRNVENFNFEKDLIGFPGVGEKTFDKIMKAFSE